MSAIARLNTSISDHTMVANGVAFVVVACVSVFSAAAIIHGGNVAKLSYNSFLETAPAAQSTVSDTSASNNPASQQTGAVVLGNSTVSAAQLQLQTVTSQLQPAVYLPNNSTVTANTLHPSGNGVQLTAASLQNATGL